MLTALTKTALLALLSILAAALCGCNIVAPAVVLLHGPPKTKAAHRLEPERPTVFFVDDRNNRLYKRSMRLTIATTAQDILLKEKELKNVVDAKAALTRVSGEPADEPTDISSLGKSVQAEVVVWIAVDAFGFSPDGVTFAPFADLRIKVIDCVNTPSRLWPEEPAGKQIRVTLPERHGTTDQASITAIAKAQDRLAQECGRVVAELFFDHETARRAYEKNQ